MSHNSLPDPEGGNYDSCTPFASMGFRYKCDISFINFGEQR